MATLKKYNLSGSEIGSLQIEDAVLDVEAHAQSIKDYLVAIRKNARQWSAHTKTRAEIARTGRKPHPQKGQGRSRQGDLAAPQYKGGGIVFGPRTKEGLHNTRINQKEKRAAIRFLIAEKIKQNRVHVLSQIDLAAPKTKAAAQFFKKLEKEGARVLVLGGRALEKGGSEEMLVKSLRNLPKKEFGYVPQMNGYSLVRSQDLVVLDTALEEFLSVLGVS